MKHLIWLPITCAVVASFALFLDPHAARVYDRCWLIPMAIIMVVSAFRAASRFSRHDHLFTTWILVGSGFSVATLRYCNGLYLAITEGPRNNYVDNPMLALQNLLLTLGLWHFTLAWKKTGLAVPVSRSKQISWTVAGIVIGLIVGGYPLVLGLRASEMDWVLPLDAIPGIICIALIVPLALSALAMRGGILMYVWAYIAASQFFYMAYDIWRGSWPALGWSMSPGRNVEEIIRALALMSYCCAAIAQRRATDQARA